MKLDRIVLSFTLALSILITSSARAKEQTFVDDLVCFDYYNRDAALKKLPTLNAYERSNTIRELGDRLNGLDGQERIYAAQALGKIGVDSIPTLVAHLVTPEGTISPVVNELAMMGSSAEDPLLKVLNQSNDLEKKAALKTFSLMSPKPNREDILSAIRPLLNSDDSETRQYATEAMGNLGSRQETEDSLLQQLKDSDANVRVAALKALEKKGVNAEFSLNSVIPLLNDRELAVQNAACLVLSEIGPAAYSAMNQLANLDRNSSDTTLQYYSNYASLMIKNRADETEINQFLDKWEAIGYPRSEEDRVFRVFKKNSQSSVPNLVRRLNSNGIFPRKFGLDSLRDLNTVESKAALLNFDNNMSSDNAKTRQSAEYIFNRDVNRLKNPKR